MGQRVDLHLHTIASEGTLTLANQFAYARGHGLSAIAIADRDVLPDDASAIPLAEQHGVCYIRGVEITAGWNGHEVHVLGYNMDPRQSQLREALSHIATSRNAHAQIMLYKLNRLGAHIRMEDVRRYAPFAACISRAHIARALVESGRVATMAEAFSSSYIADDGDCYHPSGTLSAVAAIRLLRSAGGLAVVAHPALWNHRHGLGEEDLAVLKDAGLNGIEVIHACHTAEESVRYQALAHKLGLLATGGSACRGPDHATILNFRLDVPAAFAEHLTATAAAA